jgi:hypothetical protein
MIAYQVNSIPLLKRKSKNNILTPFWGIVLEELSITGLAVFAVS